MYYTGIDIGSTSAKVVVMDNGNEVIYKRVMPTGWSSVDTAEKIRQELAETGINGDAVNLWLPAMAVFRCRLRTKPLRK